MRNINITQYKITKYIYEYRNFNYKESTIFREWLTILLTSCYWEIYQSILVTQDVNYDIKYFKKNVSAYSF